MKKVLLNGVSIVLLVVIIMSLVFSSGYISYSDNVDDVLLAKNAARNDSFTTIKAQTADFVHRSDGIWLYPLPQKNYIVNDWAGCNGNNSCYWHRGDNHGGCLADHATWNGYGHNGIDLNAVSGVTPVYASAPGTLYCTNKDWPYRGITAVVEHPIGVGTDGKNWSYYTVYQHLSATQTGKDGQYVEAGDVIATAGKTDGFGTGQSHLHFEIMLAHSGKGHDMSRDTNNIITDVENYGWVTEKGFSIGRILNNPALNSPAGIPESYDGAKPNTLKHAGSIMYTFDKKEVCIGEGASLTDDLGSSFYARIYNTAHKTYLTNDNDNVSVRNLTNDASQVWHFCKQADGSYIIKSAFDITKCLDVENACTSAGANVWVCTYNGTDAQKWYISEKNGSYVLRSKCADTVMDVHDNSPESGTNIKMWTDTGSVAQGFSISKLDDYETLKYISIVPGTYVIKQLHSNGYVNVSYGKDIDAQDIDLYSGYNDPAEQMKIVSVGGIYKILPQCSTTGKVLNVFTENVVSGNNVCLWSNTDDSSQRWIFEKAANGFIIRSAQNPTCVLDSVGIGYTVKVQTYSGASTQFWQLCSIINYDANGGKNAPTTQIKNYQTDINLSINSPTREGYRFVGWSTDKNATSASYKAGSYFSQEGSVTLYAVWEEDTGEIVKTGLIPEDGGYRFYINGVAQYGWVDTDGDGERDSYFYTTSKLRCEEDRVLFDGVDARRFFKYNPENGHMEVVNGFYTDENGTQFFIDGLGAYGWITSDGVSITDKPGITLSDVHYFAYGDGLNFYMVEDSVKTIGGVVREFDENHLVKSYTGWATNKTTGNANYYVDGVMQQGWCETPDGWVYLSRSENLANNITYGDVFYGWRKIGGKVYYFRASTSTPQYTVISDPMRQLTYNGVRSTYYTNQTPANGTTLVGSDFYITNPPLGF